MKLSTWSVVFAGTMLVWPLVGSAEPLPTREGACSHTKIAGLEQRLRNGPNGPFIAGSGSAVRFANGGYQVAYAEIEAVRNSHIGDPVLICLIRVPRRCPAGDARGRVYTTTNNGLNTSGDLNSPTLLSRSSVMRPLRDRRNHRRDKVLELRCRVPE